MVRVVVVVVVVVPVVEVVLVVVVVVVVVPVVPAAVVAVPRPVRPVPPDNRLPRTNLNPAIRRPRRPGPVTRSPRRLARSAARADIAVKRLVTSTRNRRTITRPNNRNRR